MCLAAGGRRDNLAPYKECTAKARKPTPIPPVDTSHVLVYVSDVMFRRQELVEVGDGVL